MNVLCDEVAKVKMDPGVRQDDASRGAYLSTSSFRTRASGSDAKSIFTARVAPGVARITCQECDDE